MKWKRFLSQKKRKFFLVYKRIFFIILFLAIFVLFKTPLLRIKKLDCYVGQEKCAAEVQTKVLSLVSGKSVLLLSADKLSNQIENLYPVYQKAEVKIKLPDKIQLDLTKREPICYFYFGQNKLDWFSIKQLPNRLRSELEIWADTIDQFWLADSQGIIFGKTSKDQQLPVVLVAGLDNIDQFLGKDIDKILSPSVIFLLNSLFEVGIDFDFGKYNRKEQEFVILSSQAKNWMAWFLLSKDVDKSIATLQLILKQAKIEGEIPEYIDLRFDKPVISF